LEGDEIRAEKELERKKESAEIILSTIEQSEFQEAQQRFNVQQDYFDQLIILQEKNIEERKKLGLSTEDEEKKLNDIKLKATQALLKGQIELNKLEVEESQSQIDSQKDTAQTELKLKNARNSELLFSDIEYEKQRLLILQAGGKKYEVAAKKQQEKLSLLEKEAKKQRRLENIAYTEEIINAAISATNQILSAKIKEIEGQTSLQQKRVDDARNIAEQGNAELLQEEQKRLDNLNKEKEKFVRQQQALATVELIANTAIAVSKAAAQGGGVAAGVTIAAALLALVAGLASARAISSQAAFYEGGLYEGYTGSGNPKEVSNKVGSKPYTYHKDEFIFNHKNTRKYKDIFQGVHEGKIDLHDWHKKVRAFDYYNMNKEIRQHSPIYNTRVEVTELKDQMNMLIKIVKNQSSAINIDENGFSVHLSNVKARQDYIRNMAK
jgi:hypothetical protein